MAAGFHSLGALALRARAAALAFFAPMAFAACSGGAPDLPDSLSLERSSAPALEKLDAVARECERRRRIVERLGESPVNTLLGRCGLVEN